MKHQEVFFSKNERELFNRNLFLQTKPIPSITTRSFFLMCKAASRQKISRTMVEAGLVICHDNMLAHTTLQVQKFWPLTPWLRYPILLIYLTMPYVISYSFWEWNNSRGHYFQASPKFRNNHWPLYKQFQKFISAVLPAVTDITDQLHKYGKRLS